MYTLKFDGLFREITISRLKHSRAGFISYGWLIYKQGKLIARGFGVFAMDKYAASNIAEYLALIEGLEALADIGVRKETVKIQGDAKCVIDQMSGIAGISSIPTRMLNDRASRLASSFKQVNWHWVPRRQNREADKLTKHAMRNIGNHRTFSEAIHEAPITAILDGKLASVLDLRVYQTSHLPAGGVL